MRNYTTGISFVRIDEINKFHYLTQLYTTGISLIEAVRNKALPDGRACYNIT